MSNQQEKIHSEQQPFSEQFKFNLKRKKTTVSFAMSHQIIIVVSATPFTSAESIMSTLCIHCTLWTTPWLLWVNKRDATRTSIPACTKTSPSLPANRIYLFAYTLESKYRQRGVSPSIFSWAKNENFSLRRTSRERKQPVMREFLFSCCAANLAPPNMKKISTGGEMAQCARWRQIKRFAICIILARGAGRQAFFGIILQRSGANSAARLPGIYCRVEQRIANIFLLRLHMYALVNKVSLWYGVHLWPPPRIARCRLFRGSHVLRRATGYWLRTRAGVYQIPFGGAILKKTLPAAAEGARVIESAAGDLNRSNYRTGAQEAPHHHHGKVKCARSPKTWLISELLARKM